MLALKQRRICTSAKPVTSRMVVTSEIPVSQGLSSQSPVSPLKNLEILIRAYRGLESRFVTGDVVTGDKGQARQFREVSQIDHRNRREDRYLSARLEVRVTGRGVSNPCRSGRSLPQWGSRRESFPQYEFEGANQDANQRKKFHRLERHPGQLSAKLDVNQKLSAGL